MSKTNKPDYDSVKIIFLLLGKYKKHKTWRVVFTGRSEKTMNEVMKMNGEQVEEWKVARMDATTAKITNS